MTPTELLNQQTPQPEELPARIEMLNLASLEVEARIRELKDEASLHEEDATAQAASESNEIKRRVRRSEILRDDEEYNSLCRQIYGQERVKAELSERAHRYAREYRLVVARCYQQAF